MTIAAVMMVMAVLLGQLSLEVRALRGELAELRIERLQTVARTGASPVTSLASLDVARSLPWSAPLHGNGHIEGTTEAGIDGQENVFTGDIIDDAFQSSMGDVAVLVRVIDPPFAGYEKAFGGLLVKITVATEEYEQLVIGTIIAVSIAVQGGVDGGTVRIN